MVLFFGGVLCIVEGLLNLKRKAAAITLFLISLTELSIVFLITVGCTALGFAHFNLSGGMIFLHVINPIAVLLMYYT